MFYIFQNGTFTRVTLEEAGPTTYTGKSSIVMKDLPSDLVSIAPLGKMLYYITSGSPSQVMRMNVEDNTTETIALSSPCTQLLSSCNKIYCLSAQKMFAIDPLCSEIEEFEFPHDEEMVQLKALSVGFALLAKSGRVFLFQFGVGVESSEYFSGNLLGQIRRQAVALGPSCNTLRLVPLEGAAEDALSPEGLKLDNIAAGCDETSGGVVISRPQGSFAVLSNGGNGWVEKTIDGIDAAVDTPLLLVAEPVADAVETCNICFDEITEGDAITLDCGHAFHVDCISACIMHAEKYLANGTKITFNMAMCPAGCGRIVRHPINANSKVISDRFRKVRALAAQRAAIEYPKENPSEVIDKFLYYVCDKCKQPFWGGNKDCAATLGGEPQNDPKTLICEDCQTDFVCPTHKREFVVYKCKYCCNPAVHLSFGTTRVCERCHVEKNKEVIPCPGPGKCPLPAGHSEDNEVPIGCLACLTPAEFDITKIIPPRPSE